MAPVKSIARPAPNVDSAGDRHSQSSDSNSRSYADVVKGAAKSPVKKSEAVSRRPASKTVVKKGVSSSKAIPTTEGSSGVEVTKQSKEAAKTLVQTKLTKKEGKVKFSKDTAVAGEPEIEVPKSRASSRIARKEQELHSSIRESEVPPQKKSAPVVEKSKRRKTVGHKPAKKSSSPKESDKEASLEEIPVEIEESGSVDSKSGKVSGEARVDLDAGNKSVEKSLSPSEESVPPPVTMKRKSKDVPKSVEEIKRAKLESVKAGKRVSNLGVVKDGIWFCSRRMAEKWDARKSWSIVPERFLKGKVWRVPTVLEAVNRSGLIKTIDGPGPSYHQLAMEVYANLTEDFGDDVGGRFGEVWVRNTCLTITPESINDVFEIVADTPLEFPSTDDLAAELTKGKKLRWDGKTILKAADLSSFYACLFYILSYNWLPSKNNQYVSLLAAQLLYEIGQNRKPNLGAYIFEYLCGAATSHKDKKSFGLPHLITRIIKEQAPHIILRTDIESAPLASLQADPKLFEGGHVQDCVRLGGRKALAKESVRAVRESVISSEFMISWLTGEIKELDKKKKDLEIMLAEWKAHGEAGDEDAEDASSEGNST